MTQHQNLFDRDLLGRRRARIAAKFKDHDFLLRHVAEDLNDRLQAILRDFPLTVNLGAHNGVLGKKLSTNPRTGPAIHIDPCPDMLAHAEGLKIVADEEALPLKQASIDLVVSALSLQFVNDLPGTFLQIRQCLKPDGLMLASLLGGKTLHELREAFTIAESEIEGGISPHVSPFADIRDCGALLQRAGFTLPVADTDELTVTYETPFALMHELRAMGATNILHARSKTPMKRATLLRACEIYLEKFATEDGRIPATFEVITLTGWAPHESQQQPLKPGSASHRLADALGVEEKGFEKPGKREE